MLTEKREKNTMTQPLPTWKLDDLYPGSESQEFERDLEEARTNADHCEQYLKGKIASLDGDKLAQAIERYERLESIIGRIGSYIYLQFSENMSDPERAQLYQNVSEQLNTISTKVIFFTLEINCLTDADIAERMLGSTKLQYYKPWIRDVRVFKDHQLSDEAEALLHEKAITSRQSWVRLFDETLADMRFPFQKEMVTCTEIMHHLSSSDAKKRKEAAKSLGATLAETWQIICTHHQYLSQR